VENTARYPQHFLAYAPGSDDRDAEYAALNHADPDRLPDSDPAKHTAAYQPAVVDKPVTDAMEKGGQDQRLLLALLIAVGELGALLLVGSLAVSVVLAQVVVLLLACFSPVALIAAIVPGRGHRAFTTWAGLLARYVVRKAAYSLVLAVVLAVLGALQDATTNLGWLMSFGLQALLLWTVYLQRHALAGQLTSTLTGDQPHGDAQLRRLLGLHAAQRTITHARRRHRTPTAAPRPASGVHEPAHAATVAATAERSTQRIEDEVRMPAPAAPVGANRDRQPRRPPRTAADRPDETGEHPRTDRTPPDRARQPRGIPRRADAPTGQQAVSLPDPPPAATAPQHPPPPGAEHPRPRRRVGQRPRPTAVDAPGATDPPSAEPSSLRGTADADRPVDQQLAADRARLHPPTRDGGRHSSPEVGDATRASDDEEGPA
jgi:hypothetical protein